MRTKREEKYAGVEHATSPALKVTEARMPVAARS